MNELAVNDIIVLIDSFTKGTASSITYDALAKHVLVITDLKELNEAHFKSKVVLFEPAVNMIATPALLEELKNNFELQFFIVYRNSDIVEQFKGLTTLVDADYSIIDWNLVYSAINGDMAILEPYQRSVKTIDSFQTVRNKLPDDLKEYFERYNGSYIDLVARFNHLVSEHAALEETMKAQSVIGEQTVAGIMELKKLLTEAQVRINSYEALLSKDYDVKVSGFYPDKPRILYIKQISHVAGIDILLSVLFSVLTKQYKESCKVIKLTDSSNAMAIRYVPNNYKAITDSYDTGQILTNDFLVKLGAYRVLFDTLLLNRSGLDYLIVHDMRGTPNLALDSDLINLLVHEASADYALLGEYSNMLSDHSKSAMFSWDFAECQKYTGTRIVKLANHPTVASILDYLL